MISAVPLIPDQSPAVHNTDTPSTPRRFQPQPAPVSVPAPGSGLNIVGASLHKLSNGDGQLNLIQPFNIHLLM